MQLDLFNNIFSVVVATGKFDSFQLDRGVLDLDNISLQILAEILKNWNIFDFFSIIIRYF